jgi:signal transduction histidine kinase/DNA-binding response OmpR family regulator
VFKLTDLKYAFLGFTLLMFYPAYAEENIDSLIVSWNRLSADFLQIREMDSVCKYGNCTVEMLEKQIEYGATSMQSSRMRYLKKQKAEALSYLVSAYGTSDKFNLAVECFEDALEIYNQLNADEEKYQLYIRIARVYDMRGNYFEAIPYFEKALELAAKLQDKNSEAMVHNFIGVNHRMLGNYPEALRNHLRSLEILEETDNHKGIGYSLITIAAILRMLKDYDSAIEKLLEARHHYEKLSDSAGIATVYNDLGAIYLNLGDTTLSLQNHLQAAHIRELIKEYDGLGSSNLYLSDIYLQKGDYDGALQFLEDADRAFRLGANIEGVMTTQTGIALLYFDKKEYGKALFWLEEAQRNTGDFTNYIGLLRIFKHKGTIQFIQSQYDEAIESFNKSLKYAEFLNFNREISSVNGLLAEVYTQTGDYRQALDHLNRHIQYRDSVEAKADFTSVVQMEMQYNYEKEKIQNQLEQNKKDTENQLELARQQNQNKLFLSGVGMFLLISIGLWSRLRYIRKMSNELKEQKLLAEQQKQIAENESSRAAESEKVKQLFLANMSHEIRTPMNAIKGMTDILLRNSHPQSQDIYLNAIKQSSETLLVILNDILDLSKLDAGKIEIVEIPFKPREIVGNIYNLLGYKAEEKGLKLSIEYGENIPDCLLGDPTRLNQILVNLTSNAIKFTEKGIVSIKVINIHREHNEVRLQFKVKDTGIGIVKEKIPEMFELFTQADSETTRKYGGTGLGLSICRRLVNMQNGSINVESESGRGSTFTVEIPYKIIQAEQPDNYAAGMDVVAGLKILLVDDNEFNIIVAKDELEVGVRNVVVDTAENGRVAVEKCKTGNYDIVLMDVQMPEMDGFDATRNIRQIDGPMAKVPIIAMTAFAMRSEVNRCLDAGMNDFVPKPFKREELMKALKKWGRVTPLKASGNNHNAIAEKPKSEANVQQNGKITNLAFLREFCKNDQQKMDKYVSMFLKSTPANLEKIAQALDTTSVKDLKLLIHSMKPHFNFMGMNETRLLADEIENDLLSLLEEFPQAQPQQLNEIIIQKIDSFVSDCKISINELSS